MMGSNLTAVITKTLGLLLLSCLFGSVSCLCCFCSSHNNQREARKFLVERSRPSFFAGPEWLSLLSTSNNNNGNNGNEDELTNSMRRMLEVSWNAQAMGNVPGDPASAAIAAATALHQALRDDSDTTSNNVVAGAAYFIDLQFPPYDKSQGDNMYDEVSLVEFCMELAQQLGRTSGEDNNDLTLSSSLSTSKTTTTTTSSSFSSCLILVKDDQALQTVNRVLSARERSSAAKMEDYEDEDEEGDEDYDNGKDGSSTEFYDDFADFGMLGESKNDAGATTAPTSSSSSFSNDDINSFRQRLMSSWEGSADRSTMEPQPEPESENIPMIPKSKTSKKVTESDFYSASSLSSSPFFRLASLFGKCSISKGADMGGDVMNAIRENVQPSDHERTLILVSASSREELMATRGILQQTKKDALTKDVKRTIVLVNCRLDPLPRELGAGSKTVYSIQPFLARQAASTTSPFQKPQAASAAAAAEQSPIKVVVMRRYPQDWQVFVDDGTTGTFELAATAMPGYLQQQQRAPPMQWISNCIKTFLQKKMG